MANSKLFALLLALLGFQSTTAANSTAMDLETLGRVDAWSICVPTKNSCASNRCRLNETISENTPVPSWVGKPHRELVEQTISGTRAQLQDNISTEIARSYYGQVCFNSTGGLHWAAARYYDAADEACFSGYAAAGYHPFGTQPGFWLTQIMALTDSFTNWMNGGNHSLVDGFYVNITKLSDIVPGEAIFDLVSSLDEWQQRYDYYRRPNVSLYSKPEISRNRTDQDLIARGFDYKCCSVYRKTSLGDLKCQNYSLLHQDCSTPLTELGRNATMSGTWAGQTFGVFPDCPGAAKLEASGARNSFITPLQYILVSTIIILLL